MDGILAFLSGYLNEQEISTLIDQVNLCRYKPVIGLKPQGFKVFLGSLRCFDIPWHWCFFSCL